MFCPLYLKHSEQITMLIVTVATNKDNQEENELVVHIRWTVTFTLVLISSFLDLVLYSQESDLYSL